MLPLPPMTAGKSVQGRATYPSRRTARSLIWNSKRRGPEPVASDAAAEKWDALEPRELWIQMSAGNYRVRAKRPGLPFYP